MMPTARFLQWKRGDKGSATIAFSPLKQPACQSITTASSTSTSSSSSSSLPISEDIVFRFHWSHESRQNVDVGGYFQCEHIWSVYDESGISLFHHETSQTADDDDDFMNDSFGASLQFRSKLRQLGVCQSAIDDSNPLSDGRRDIYDALRFLHAAFSSIEPDDRVCQRSHTLDPLESTRLLRNLASAWKMEIRDGELQDIATAEDREHAKHKVDNRVPRTRYEIFLEGVTSELFQEDVLDLLPQSARQSVHSIRICEDIDLLVWSMRLKSESAASAAAQKLNGVTVRGCKLKVDPDNICSFDAEDDTDVDDDEC